MKIKSLNIKNFKSIVDITINEPNPFTVFVGPNGSGKSNIFEALEYRFFKENFRKTSSDEDFERVDEIIAGLFPNRRNFNRLEVSNIELDGKTVFFNRHLVEIEIRFDTFSLRSTGLSRFGGVTLDENGNEERHFPFEKQKSYQQFISNHSEIFIKNKEREKLQNKSDRRLSTSCDNLEKVLKRILENPTIREEFSEWLDLFIPEFDRIEVRKAEYSSNEDLLIFQKHYQKPFNKELISDGTYNIIALLTAVYQSDEPQFLCIEEPENGLHPQVIKELVNFFRWACEDKGHYIWLNTHSQTLVDCLTTDEIILVDKTKGETIVKQLRGRNLHNLPASDAWLSGALGGGVVW